MRLKLEEYVKGWKYHLGVGGRGYSYRWYLEEVLISYFPDPINVLEFGGGLTTKHIRSYRNIANHIIIESLEIWHNIWETMFPQVKMYLSPKLYDVGDKLPKDFFDLIMIDGNVIIDRKVYESKRVDCFIIATKLLKSDGVIIYHDAHRRRPLLREAINKMKCEIIKTHLEKPISKIDRTRVETWMIKKRTERLIYGK